MKAQNMRSGSIKPYLGGQLWANTSATNMSTTTVRDLTVTHIARVSNVNLLVIHPPTSASCTHFTRHWFVLHTYVTDPLTFSLSSKLHASSQAKCLRDAIALLRTSCVHDRYIRARTEFEISQYHLQLISYTFIAFYSLRSQVMDWYRRMKNFSRFDWIKPEAREGERDRRGDE